MYKKTLKTILICASVVLFTAATGLTAYFATENILRGRVTEGTAEAVMSGSVPSAPLPSVSASGSDGYYIARLNGSKIEIYLVYGAREKQPKEKYLYSFDVYRGGIPENDISDLSRGIILRTREELASFEEDFGS